MPLQKYGFHGLSYASIVRSMAKQLEKDESDINLVVAHLGSGASACCIKSGRSIDTSMGLTPLEGLIGGTRSGTIDPTAIFHHTPGAAEDAGLSDMHVSKAELLLNKECGLKALAGTTDFATITDGMGNDPKLRLAYDVYVDRLMGYISQYLFKLLGSTPISEISIVFSGGIGEKSAVLHKDVLDRLAWLGVKQEAGNKGQVTRLTADDSALAGWVVETDEEGWSIELARQHLDI